MADAAPIFFKQNKTDAAVGQFRAMLANNAHSAEAHYFLGVIADRQGKINEEAAEEFRQALRLQPDFAEARNQLQQLDRKKP